MPGVDIVIPNYNGAALLTRYLPGVVEAAAGSSVIVVDDGSNDGSVERLRVEFPAVRVVARDSNGGFSKTANDGIRAAESDLIALLNNDVEVLPGFLNSILPMFEDESVFAVSPKIVLPRHGGIDEGAKTGFWHHGMFYADQKQGVNAVTPVLYACACAAVYRKSMLHDLGGFDEAYSPFYWEDTDLGYRAWKRGWSSLYQPASMVIHQHSASIGAFDPVRTHRIRVRNSFMFIWRNIEDATLLAAHRKWLPLVLAKKLAQRDRGFVFGWMDAWRRRRECLEARDRNSAHRRLSDEGIFALC